MATAPKSSVFDTTGLIKPITTPAGRVITAVRPTANVSPTPVGPPEQAAVQTQLPLEISRLRGAPLTPEQVETAQLEQFAEVAGPAAIGEFVPSSPAEEAAIRRGRARAVFQEAFSQGIIGSFLDLNRLTPAERDRLQAEVSNFTINNGFTAAVSGIAGRFLSDSPIEVGIALLTGPLGIALETAAVTGSISRSALRATQALQRARVAGRTFAGKTLVNAQRDALEGFASGTVSESILQGMGKGGDVGNIIEVGVIVALASPFFGFALRNAFSLGKVTFTKARGQFIDKASKDIAEDTGLPESQIKPVLESRIIIPERPRIIEPEGIVTPERPQILGARGEPVFPEARRLVTPETPRVITPERPQILGARGEPAVPEPTQLRVRADTRPGQRAVDAFNKNPTRATLTTALRNLGDDAEFPSVRVFNERIDGVVDALEMRARSAGQTLDQFMEAKNLKLELADRVSTVFRDTETIIRAPFRGGRPADFLHEVGHIARSDITPAHQKAFEDAFGFNVEEGVPWTVQQEELVADSIQSFLESGGKRVNPPQGGESRGLRRAFKAFIDWFKNVYGRLAENLGLRKEQTDDLIERLFTEGPEAVAVPTPEGQVAFARGLRERGVEELFAPARKKPKRKPLPKDVQETQANLERIARESTSESRGIASGTGVPKSPAGRLYNNVKKKLGKLYSNGVITLNGFIPRMGKVFNEEIHPQIASSANRSAELNQTLINTNRAGMKGVSNDDIVKLNDKTDLTLETKTNFTGKGKSLKFLRETIKATLTGFERIKLFMYSLDGFNADKSAVTSNAAQLALSNQKGGVIINGKKRILTNEQVTQIAEGDFLSPKEKEIANAFLGAYRSIVDDANAITRPLIGRGVFVKENFFYNPKRTIETDAENNVDLLFSSLLSERDLGRLAKGPLRARKGLGTLELSNPFSEFNFYTRRVPQVLGYAKFNKEFEVAIDASKTEIINAYGRDTFNALKSLVEVNSGDVSQIGQVTGGGPLNKLFSLETIGILSINPSVILKQFGSAFTAFATGKIDIRPGELLARASQLAVNSKARKEVVDEMIANSPFFARRQQARVQFIELEDATGGIGEVQIAKGDLPIKDIIDLARKRGIKITDAWVQILQKTMVGIRVADEAMMAAVWEATKRTARKADPNSTLAQVNNQFTDISLQSQPTVDPVSRSMFQMNPNIITKAITRFTTQTRKIAEMLDAATTDFVNIPKELRTASDKEKYMQTVLPLLAQAAFTTAAGTIGAGILNQTTNLFRSERRIKRREAAQQAFELKLFQGFTRNLVGPIPVAGPVIAEMLSAFTAGKPFGTTIPVIQSFTELSEGIADRNARKISNTILRSAGIGSLLRTPGAETIGRLQE